LTSCAALDIETEPAIPPPEKPEHSELCVLIAPHSFADATLGFFDDNRHDPGVVADLDWIGDVAKVRRCLCSTEPAARVGCPGAGQGGFPTLDRSMGTGLGALWSRSRTPTIGGQSLENGPFPS
jgi:hypothetical protein